MRTVCRLLPFIGVLAGCLCAHAVTLDMSFDADVKVTSAYLWRGSVISDDWCIQPSLTASGKGVSLYLWGTWDLTGATNGSERTRMDADLGYTYEYKKLMMRGGFIAYIYKDSLVTAWQKDTFEAYVGCDIDVPTLPTWTLYYDFGEIEGFYTTIGLRHSFEIAGKKGWSSAFDIRADLGAADENYNDKRFSFPVNAASGELPYEPHASLVDFTGTISLPISIGEHFTLTPAVKYMTLVDSKIKEAAKNAGQDTDGTAYSVTIGTTF
jgi:hypothetical protein